MLVFFKRSLEGTFKVVLETCNMKVSAAGRASHGSHAEEWLAGRTPPRARGRTADSQAGLHGDEVLSREEEGRGLLGVLDLLPPALERERERERERAPLLYAKLGARKLPENGVVEQGAVRLGGPARGLCFANSSARGSKQQDEQEDLRVRFGGKL